MATFFGTNNSENSWSLGPDSVDGDIWRSGFDSIDAAGNDSIFGGEPPYNANEPAWGLGSDTLQGYAGSDQLFGGAGDDWLFGNAKVGREAPIDGDDILWGGLGNDGLFGQAGNDTLEGGAGGDTLDGGAGTNWLSYSADTAGVTVDLRVSSTQGGDAAGDSLAGVFGGLIGGSGNDRLTGTDNLNDTIIGGAGNDTLFGAFGGDTLQGGAGNDSLIGGDGDDAAIYAGSRDRFAVTDLGGGLLRISDTVGGASEGTDTVADVERFVFNGTTLTRDQLLTVENDDFADDGSDTTVPVGAIQVGGSAIGTIETAGDRDIFAITLVANQAYRFDLAGSGTGAGTLNDPVLRLLDASGNQLLRNDDWPGGGLDSRLFFVTDDPGVFYLEAAGFSVSSLGTYTLRATAVDGVIIIGSTFDETISGATSAFNQPRSSDGADSILAGIGNDWVDARGGNDTIVGDFGNDTLDGKEDDDSISGGVGDDLLYGGNGADHLLGGEGKDTLGGGEGFFASIDTLEGGADDDVYVVGFADIVRELADGGVDEVRARHSWVLTSFVENLILFGPAEIGVGNELANRLSGNAVANTLLGLQGDDTLFGNGGADTLDGGLGNDRMNGGAGNDIYIVDAPDDAVIEASNQGLDIVRTTLAQYTLASNVENLTATSAIAHTLSGNTLANLITGNAGADTIFGGLGNDTLDGAGGVDRLVGGDGADRYIATAGDTVIESANQGADTVVATTGSAFTLSSNVETLLLEGSTLVTGVGNAGDNALHGNGNSNVLFGQAGNDFLNGASGSDVLIGGFGRDTLMGGAGADQFRLLASGESTAAATDLILDFDFVTGDRVDLRTIDANVLAANNQAFRYIGATSFTGLGEASAGELRVVSLSSGVYRALGDTDGNGFADLVIGITSATAPGSGWFLL